MPDNTRAAAGLVGRLIDRGYLDATEATIRAIAMNGSSGALDQRLSELRVEAERLEGEGKKLTPDNPIVRALLADFEDAMRANRLLIAGASESVELSALDVAADLVRQLALPGFDDNALAALGIQWNRPDVEAVRQAISYINADAFAAKLARYEVGTVEQVRGIAARMFAEGYGPRLAADLLAQAVQGLPASHANQLMRTLQLTTLRDAQVVHRVANAQILEYQIRIAALDDRTCLACVALHGQRLPIDARIDDHHNGRCTSVTKVKGLGAPTVVTGPEWFASLPQAKQQSMMGAAMWDAWDAGAVTWQDIPREYEDDLFGRMIGEASLKGILGKGAQGYYDGAQN